MAKVVLFLFLVGLGLMDMGEAKDCGFVCGFVGWPPSLYCSFQCRWTWKRSASEPSKEGVFQTLDADADNFLTVEEWHAQKNSVINFAKFLESMDKDGDEMISWDEFQELQHVYVTQQIPKSSNA